LLKNYHYLISTKDAFHKIQQCIQEVLSVDVRSQYQTKKARKRNSKAERADRMKEVHHSATNKKANTRSLYIPKANEGTFRPLFIWSVFVMTVGGFFVSSDTE